MRNVLLGVVAALLAAVLIAVVISTGDSPATKTKTVTVPALRGPSSQAHSKAPITATLPLLPTSRADGAQGTVSVQMVPGARFRLTVNLIVPQKSYGVALWSNRHKYRGLYTGYRGRNSQTLIVGASRVLQYRWLAVGQTVITTRIRRVRVGGVVRRSVRQSVANHHLLRISTERVLGALLQQAASR
jgi:hypothetical protein